MSQQATQPGATELDANIDALFNQLEPTAGAAATTSPVTEAAPVADPIDSVMAEPAMSESGMPEPVVESPAPVSAVGEEPDALLAEVSQEIERESPAHAEPDAAFEAPSAEELQIETGPVPVARTSEPAPVNIDRLDAALAANADKALAAAQDDLAAAPKPVAAKPTPVPPPPAPVAKHHEPEVIPDLPEPSAPVVHAPAVEASASDAGVVALHKPSLMQTLAGTLQPLAALHERLGESARQTIGYCAVLTLFSASCAWGLVYFMKPKELEPARGEQPFIYNDTVPAHGVTAPPRHTAEPKAAAHGEGGGEGGGHGDAAKKDAHAKPAKKSASSEHGEAAAEKKTSSHSKKAAKAAEHGEH